MISELWVSFQLLMWKINIHDPIAIGDDSRFTMN